MFRLNVRTAKHPQCSPLSSRVLITLTPLHPYVTLPLITTLGTLTQPQVVYALGHLQTPPHYNHPTTSKPLCFVHYFVTYVPGYERPRNLINSVSEWPGSRRSFCSWTKYAATPTATPTTGSTHRLNKYRYAISVGSQSRCRKKCRASAVPSSMQEVVHGP